MCAPERLRVELDPKDTGQPAPGCLRDTVLRVGQPVLPPKVLLLMLAYWPASSPTPTQHTHTQTLPLE